MMHQSTPTVLPLEHQRSPAAEVPLREAQWRPIIGSAGMPGRVQLMNARRPDLTAQQGVGSPVIQRRQTPFHLREVCGKTESPLVLQTVARRTAKAGLLQPRGVRTRLYCSCSQDHPRARLDFADLVQAQR